VRGEGLAGAPGDAGAPRSLTVYCSAEAHSSLTKAVELLGMGTRALRRVPTDDLLRIDLEALAEMVARDRENGLLPICVVGVAGTTNTGSIDDLRASPTSARGRTSGSTWTAPSRLGGHRSRVAALVPGWSAPTRSPSTCTSG